MLNENYNYQQRYHPRKKVVHFCKLPKQENVKIDEHYPDSYFITKKFFSLCLITTDVSRRKIYSKSHKVLENERRIHMQNYKYIIHPFSDFAYYWQLFMVIVFFVQLALTPTFIILRTNMIYSSIYFILITQIISCLNMIVFCFTGYYKTDIVQVVFEQNQIILNYIKYGNLIIDLLGSLPLSFISYLCGAPIITECLLACSISLNIFPLMRYLEFLRQRRGFSFLIFRLFDALLVFIFGIIWFAVLIFVSAHLDQYNIKSPYDVKVWWWVYNSYTLIYGTEIKDFCFTGYEFFISTAAIIFGVLIRKILLVQIIIICTTWYSSEGKRARLFNEINEFCHYKRLPYNLKQRLVQYYKFKLHNVYYNEIEIQNQLSENLRYNIKHYTCRAWFEADIFKLCPSALRQLITIHLDEDIYLKNDVIYKAGDVNDYIYFIKSGSILCIQKGTSEMYEVSEGNFFSEKTLLSEENSSHSRTVIAMETSQILTLSKANFFKIIKNFQAAYATILDILETRKKYLYKKTTLKSRLYLEDYYQYAFRRLTDAEETEDIRRL